MGTIKRMEVSEIIQAQKAYFQSGKTLDVFARMAALKRLRGMIETREEAILEALREDLGKSHFEGYMSEVGMVLDELTYMRKNLARLAGPRRVRTPLAQFSARSYKLPSPYGCVLIISPWNYPFYLSVTPMVDALAGGNTVVIKPSAYSPATSAIVAELVRECFPPEYVAVVSGGRDVNQSLLDQPFDYIFFTGSKTVGRLVMEKASAHLTPVTLELGGKSPCIVDRSADLKTAAARIAFGKFLNVGQTCVAPDYLIVHADIRDEFLPLLAAEIHKQYGQHPLENADYGRIINDKHFQRLLGLLESGTIYAGGRHDGSRRIEPTVLTDVRLDSPIMQEEIFGPLLPVLTFHKTADIYPIVAANPTPLAFYLFTTDKAQERELTRRVSFGGGCVNDTIIHLATTEMGFGGVGESGMGSYHGQAGFDTFTHYKSMVNKANWIDLKMRYQPYSEAMLKVVKMFLK